MKALIIALWLSPLAIVVAISIQFVLVWRRHNRLMALFKQADVINEQVKKAIREENIDLADFHIQRHKELFEMIQRERLK
jgi:hypothetical protein